VWVAATALRFYHTTIWAKLGAGLPLNEGDKEWIRQALHRAQDTWASVRADLVRSSTNGRPAAPVDGERLLAGR
jgi:hypothetical protein